LRWSVLWALPPAGCGEPVGLLNSHSFWFKRGRKRGWYYRLGSGPYRLDSKGWCIDCVSAFALFVGFLPAVAITMVFTRSTDIGRFWLIWGVLTIFFADLLDGRLREWFNLAFVPKR